VRSSARSPDDGDVIRARLRALLAEGQPRGWVPADDDPEEPDDDLDGEDDDLDGDDDEQAPPDTALPAGLGRHRAPGRTARLDPGRPGAWALWVAAVLAALAVVGWTWLDRPVVDRVPTSGATGSAGVSTPPASSAPTSAAPSAGPVVVSVVGQVVAPGLVTLPAGSRVADALLAVGGLLPEADPGSVNGAALLTDGEQIAVGVPGAAAPPGVAGGTGGGAANGGLLDLNTATVGDLDALPGIGPVLAQRIVDHRSARGAFTSVEQLDDVPGIGPAIYAELSGQVTV
jgi:competence protein ComEA